MLGNSRVDAQLAASQEGLSSMEMVSYALSANCHFATSPKLCETCVSCVHHSGHVTISLWPTDFSTATADLLADHFLHFQSFDGSKVGEWIDRKRTCKDGMLQQYTYMACYNNTLIHIAPLHLRRHWKKYEEDITMNWHYILSWFQKDRPC
jgi:hypothetical protein